MIRNIIIFVVCVLFLSGYAFAEKPPWAGKGKPTAEQKQAHKKDSDSELIENQKGEKDKTEKEKYPKGLEKQQEKKSAQEQKELDKGSDKGQESREKRKKWWKLWE